MIVIVKVKEKEKDKGEDKDKDEGRRVLQQPVQATALAPFLPATAPCFEP